MGRVSKHKKIKSCDPFYKGPRTNPVRKGDLPPDNDEDQPPPKSFLRFLRHNKQFQDKAAPTAAHSSSIKMKRTRKKAVTKPDKASDPKNSASAQQDSSPAPLQGVSPADPSTPPLQGVSPADPPPPGSRAAMFTRRPGETMRSYLERIDIESKNRIVDCFRKERKKKSSRRKEYLEERRKKLKSRKRKQAEPGFNDLKDTVKFGEVVQAPPRLSAKPRGSEKMFRKTPKHELLKASSLLDPRSQLTGGLKRQKDIEEEREAVIKKYREMKRVKLKKDS